MNLAPLSQLAIIPQTIRTEPETASVFSMTRGELFGGSHLPSRLLARYLGARRPHCNTHRLPIPTRPRPLLLASPMSRLAGVAALANSNFSCEVHTVPFSGAP